MPDLDYSSFVETFPNSAFTRIYNELKPKFKKAPGTVTTELLKLYGLKWDSLDAQVPDELIEAIRKFPDSRV